MTEKRSSIENTLSQHLGESVLILKDRYLAGLHLTDAQKLGKHAWKSSFGFDGGTQYSLVGQNDGKQRESVRITATDLDGFDNPVNVELSIPPKYLGQNLSELAQIANNLHVITESYDFLPGTGEVTISTDSTPKS